MVDLGRSTCLLIITAGGDKEAGKHLPPEFMAIERNDKGQLRLDPLELAKEAAADNVTRYNGGWVKSIMGLNKQKTDGYSLVGEFHNEGLQWLSPGLYLDCSKGDSRNYPRSTYTLFHLHLDGAVTTLKTVKYSRDWAVRLWPAIQEALAAEVKGIANQTKGSPLKNMSDDDVIREIVHRRYLVTKTDIVPEESANAS